MKNRIFFLLVVAFIISLFTISLPSCKSCKKNDATQTVVADTTAPVVQLQNMINLPHADTSVIPELSKVLDDAFEASDKKDYNRLGSAIVYRGPEEAKAGNGVFNAKNKFDRNVVKITADVFSKWNKNTESREYARAFELPQPNGANMVVLEVIFVSPKNINRKFFGFMKLNEEWKIADVTSYL